MSSSGSQEFWLLTCFELSIFIFAIISCWCPRSRALKTHHNDTQLVRDLRARGRVIEPLKDYHKDEVRALGRDLGLPDDLVQRQPFPGSLASRQQN